MQPGSRDDRMNRNDMYGRKDRRGGSGKGRRRGGGRGPRPPMPRRSGVNLADLESYPFGELLEISRELGLAIAETASKDELVAAIVRAQSDREGLYTTEGLLDLLTEGYGFLRFSENSFMPGTEDIYVSPALVARYELRTGDTIGGLVRPPREDERYPALLRVDTVNFGPPEATKSRTLFENLTPLYPEEKLDLEYAGEEFSTRVMDIFTPIGKGQRALIVAPPRTGKTMLLQAIAHAVETNHPEVLLMVLLVDERPEEVTDMQRSVRGEVISSTFDEPPERHVKVTELALAKAKRLVEMGRDVLILTDSITRLARAYNTVLPSSGKVLTGGVDAHALEHPKRFFGAARNIEEGGSLTIIATALIDTGSRMDDVIFEEFKGTGNMELHLDRKLADKRVFPAIDLIRSGTRKEELLIEPKLLERVWALRKGLSSLQTVECMETLMSRLKPTKTNEEFLMSLRVGA
jgi:transcription termination factor Rho